jgi:hypothetical protein
MSGEHLWWARMQEARSRRTLESSVATLVQGPRNRALTDGVVFEIVATMQ